MEKIQSLISLLQNFDQMQSALHELEQREKPFEVSHAHLREKNDYWTTPEFLEFAKTTEYLILKFLLASIVRDSPNNFSPEGHSFMVNKFFKKGILAARYSQSDIAKYFGWEAKGKPNQGYVSNILKKHEKRGMVQIERSTCPMGKKCEYILGFHNGKAINDENYEEILFFDFIFTPLAARAKKKRNEDRGVIYGPERRKYIREQLAFLTGEAFCDDLFIEDNVCETSPSCL